MENQPQPIAIWLESVCLSTSKKLNRSPAEIEALVSKDEAILALLGKLSLHYWRPGFSPAQAKQLYADYLDDLREYSFEDINDAILKHRRSDAAFYPTCGQLVAFIRTIPSWDIRSAKEHSEILHRRAAEEFRAVVAQLEADRPVSLNVSSGCQTGERNLTKPSVDGARVNRHG